MAQPTLPIPSGTANISFFDRTDGKKCDIFRLRKSMFLQKRSSFVALIKGDIAERGGVVTAPGR